MKWPIYIVIIFIGGIYAVMAQAAVDSKNGHRVFLRCKACHSLESGRNGVGPNLHGLFGRQSGAEPNYNYSKAMKTANITWNEDTLLRYLQDPKAVVPGDKMAFGGVKDEQQLRDLVAYLKEATK